MGAMRDVEIVWDDLLDAFRNRDAETVFFLDRETGDVFSVPVDYEDDAFWEEIESEAERFIEINGADYDQERFVTYEFIKGVTNSGLKSMLEKSFTGNRLFGRLDEILSFYPEEHERLIALQEEMLSERIRHWLEEHDIYPAGSGD
jgi:hypothetical protein